MKINRLLEIAMILMNKGKTTAGELAEKFGVSTRTIYRDVDILSAAGIPVYTSKGSGGGIGLLEEYTINKAMLNQNERDSLLLALKSFQSTSYPEIDTALDKLGAVFRTSEVVDWIDVDYLPWGSGPRAGNKLLLMKKAILESKVITFEYLNSQGERTIRSAEPHLLQFKGQAWYLIAFCRLRNEPRIFRLTRMKDVKVTDEPFKRRDILDINNVATLQTAPVNEVTLKLRFQPEDLFRVYDDFDEENMSRNEDGTYDVTMTFPESEWVYGYIMSFGENVEVLEPPQIRKIVAARMKQALKKYSVKK